MLQIGMHRDDLVKTFLTDGQMVSRTHSILRSVSQDDMKGQRIDFLFVFS
jgi:hypothetical protein